MVNVDTVYQRVLALANKEQRGYITPQEFNLFANQAQMDIFEQYFYDLNQFKRIPGNDSIYADMTDIIEEKISHFKTGPIVSSYEDLVPDSYRITDVSFSGKIAEEIRCEDLHKTQNTPLTKATRNRPIWYRKEGKMYWEPQPPSLTNASINYIRKPNDVNWTYIVVGEKALVNNSASAGYKDFELHPSEETKLVIKILGLAGITLKDPALYQIAGAEDNKNIQQEKQ
jgi:hypothetical protein